MFTMAISPTDGSIQCFVPITRPPTRILSDLESLEVILRLTRYDPKSVFKIFDEQKVFSKPAAFTKIKSD